MSGYVDRRRAQGASDSEIARELCIPSYQLTSGTLTVSDDGYSTSWRRDSRYSHTDTPSTTEHGPMVVNVTAPRQAVSWAPWISLAVTVARMVLPFPFSAIPDPTKRELR